eukprot:SAG25_NODE_696_length_5890_cov_4.438612_4_plen_88_part_00
MWRQSCSPVPLYRRIFFRWEPAPILSEPAVTDRQGIGFGWLQNAWLLHARLKIHRGGILYVYFVTIDKRLLLMPRLWLVQKTRGPVH